MINTINQMFCLTLLGITFYWHDNYWRSVWWDKWFFLMIACTGLISYHFGKRFHWSVGVSFFITMLSATWGFGWQNIYKVDLVTIVAMGKVAAYSFAAILTLATTVYFFRKKEFELLGTLFAAICFFNSILIIYQWSSGKPYTGRGGLFGNPSISGCLIAFTYPFLCLQKRQPLFKPNYIAYVKRALYVLLPILAIILTEQSQPMGVFVVVLSAWYFAKRRNYKDFIVALSVFTSLGLFALWINSDRNNNIFSSSGRFYIWEMIFNWWTTYGNILFGQGTGVSQILIPMIQKAYIPQVGSTQNWWLWFHSDWLQLLFENGVVGFISGLTMYGFAVYKSYKKTDWLFAAVIGIGATAIFNFPAHFPMHAFICVTILAMAFDREYLRSKEVDLNVPSQ